MASSFQLYFCGAQRYRMVLRLLQLVQGREKGLESLLADDVEVTAVVSPFTGRKNRPFRSPRDALDFAVPLLRSIVSEHTEDRLHEGFAGALCRERTEGARSSALWRQMHSALWAWHQDAAWQELMPAVEEALAAYKASPGCTSSQSFRQELSEAAAYMLSLWRRSAAESADPVRPASRKRLRASLAAITLTSCPHCGQRLLVGPRAESAESDGLAAFVEWSWDVALEAYMFGRELLTVLTAGSMYTVSSVRVFAEQSECGAVCASRASNWVALLNKRLLVGSTSTPQLCSWPRLWPGRPSPGLAARKRERLAGRLLGRLGWPWSSGLRLPGRLGWPWSSGPRLLESWPWSSGMRLLKPTSPQPEPFAPRLLASPS